ncbi:MFS transporter [uncultured Sphaerochaeta sp.]|uniref:MFS transporter n=1 Tax=uncultured Sphaerochaeta sp. TaxID=886478 RepID=UPI002A0A2CBA|nr:MFS transporter [uncultured Sphaerochaeta sp.]
MFSKRIMASYGFGKFIAEFFTGAFGAIVFMFYETEVGLAGGYAALATVIYSLWNAFNDPVIGYATNKFAPLSKKYGRRFPWIIIGLVLCSLSFLAIFAIPTTWNAKEHPLPVFLWMVLSICLFDGLYSLWEVNYQSVYPDKFRTDKERTMTAAISTGIGVLGIASGFIIPPLFFEYGNRASYALCGLVIAGIGILCTLLVIPGVHETKEMIERFSRQQKENAIESPSFFTQMKKGLKDKNLLAFVLFLFFYQSGCMCMTSSINYVVKYILAERSTQSTPIFAGMLVGALVSILIWTQVAKKMQNNQKMLVVCALFMSAFALPLTFVSTQLGFIICMSLWGLGFGGFWTFMGPAMADVIDDLVVRQKRRDDGIIMGIRAFFMRFSYASQAVVFYLTHKLTGFNPDNITPLAKKGISLHIGLIPSIFFLLGVIVFLSMNTLTPQTIKSNRQLLKQLDV